MGDFYGGISIDAASRAADLDSAHFLYDETNGFLALMKMFDRDLNAKLGERTLTHSQWTIRAPMLALTNPDPALGLPAGTTLKPAIFLSNPSAGAFSAQVTFHWRSGTTIGKGTVSVSLDPHATSIVDVAALQANGTIPASAQWAYVSIAAPIKPDDLLAVATSFDETGKLGAQTPFTDQASNHWAGGMWEVDPTHDTFIAVGNAGNSASKARITFYYNSGQGKYQMEQTLAPDEQVWLDIGKLIRNQVPDVKGSTIPVNIMSGSYELDNRTDKPAEGLFEGKLVVDKTYGYAVHGCAQCCPETYNRHILPNPLNLSVGGEASMSAVGTDDCSGNVVPLTALNWATVNHQVATASGNLIDAAGAGSTTDSATIYYKGMDTRGYCKNYQQTINGTVNVPSAALSQRTSSSASSDDSALQAYNTAEGTTSLGAIIGMGTPIQGCFTGNEVVGTITPSTYTGNVTLHRWILADAYYKDQTPISGGVTNQDDTSLPGLRDDDPQSGGSAGKVYDLDAPGINIHNADGIIYRYRGNFYAWAALSDGTRISPYYNYSVRVSCVRTTSGYHFDNTLPGDNQIQAGTTLTTWNFK